MPHAPAPSTTYQRLRHYIAKRMRISHIYQPLMLMELLGRSSPAPAQDVARRGLGEDVTQIEYYTERVKRIVGRVLTGNGITAYGDGHRSPISGSVNYRVHRCAQGRCECCGAHEHQRALEVDHIIPRNQGGSDDITNLQALCFRCNAGKRDTDCTDFRRVQASYGHREAGCVFRALEGSGRVLLENGLALPRRHVVGAMGSALQVTLHRVGGPGCDADAEEALILRPDGAFQWQRQRQGRPVILVADPRQASAQTS